MGTQQSIVILTGAGVSAESGIRTFRDQNGLWKTHRFEEVASPEGFQQDPGLVHEFYNTRRAQLLSPEVKPNPAHVALAQYERTFEGKFLLVTQNVDDLHERAGSQSVIHMHGELLKSRCTQSGRIFECRESLSVQSRCRCCGIAGNLRPHIVWFGEIPFGMDKIHAALEECGLFVAIGTSGRVYPAADFVRQVSPNARKVEINLEPSATSEYFNEHIHGKAGERVPEFLRGLF